MRTTTIPTRLLLLTAFGVTLVSIGATGSDAADPFVAGGRSTRAVAVDAATANRALDRAAEVSRTLGLPGERRRVERLDDKFDHLVYDEVVSTDRTGRAVAVTRFRTDGRLVMAVALGWQGRAANAVAREVAADRATGALRAAGIKPRGKPTLGALSSGWSVQWPRIVSGVPVRGDGIRVLLWPDGSFHGLAVSDRPLAAASNRRITTDQVRRIVLSTVASRYGPSARDVAIESSDLMWIAPNDTWNAAAPDAPAATMRLAWVVRLRTDGALAERLRGLEVWLDAGNGNVIGGDVLE